MLNPITEMKADIITAKVLHRDLNDAIKDKKKAITQFLNAQDKVEQIAQATPQAKEEKAVAKPSPLPNKPKQIIHDADKERELLKMAKAHYENYTDVSRFAQALSLTPGIVYLTLKHHGFIKQNETTEYRVLDAYYRYNGNLKAITTETGLGVWICAKTLENLGLSPKWATYKDRAESGSKGDWAEEEFRRLVPSAVDMNMHYQMNNERFDFIVNEQTIDVKLASPHKVSGNYVIPIRRMRGRNNGDLPDFFCIFLLKERDKPYNECGYHILLIPSAVFPSNRETINVIRKGKDANSSMYWDFEVEPAALAVMLGDI